MSLHVRPMTEKDAEQAERVLHDAFTPLLEGDPAELFWDRQIIRPRFLTFPDLAWIAEQDGEIVAAVVNRRWGRFMIPGPIGVLPQHQGIIGGELIARCIEAERSHGSLLCVSTFAGSTLHLTMWQRLDCWPQTLNVVMQKRVRGSPPPPRGEWMHYSTLGLGDRAAALASARALLETLQPELDLSRELEATREFRFGETLLRFEGSQLVGFVNLHCGPNSEAGSGVCYLRFGAVRSDAQGSALFRELLEASLAYAISRGATRLEAACQTGRYEAYRAMLSFGYRPLLVSQILIEKNTLVWNRPGMFVTDDWR